MTNADIAAQIRHIINGELDDCERALKAGDTTRALRELDDAMTRLRRLAAQLR